MEIRKMEEFHELCRQVEQHLSIQNNQVLKHVSSGDMDKAVRASSTANGLAIALNILRGNDGKSKQSAKQPSVPVVQESQGG